MDKRPIHRLRMLLIILSGLLLYTTNWRRNNTWFKKQNQIDRILSSCVQYDPWFATKIPMVIHFWLCRMRLYLFLHNSLQDLIADPMKSDKTYFSDKLSDIFLILHPCKPKKAKGSLVCRNSKKLTGIIDHLTGLWVPLGLPHSDTVILWGLYTPGT